LLKEGKSLNDLSLKGAFKTRGFDYDCNSGAFNTIEISLIAPLNDLFNTLDAVQTKQNHHKDNGLKYFSLLQNSKAQKQ